MPDVTLLTSIVEYVEDHGGGSAVCFSLSGEPHAAAIVDAVAADYTRRTGRPEITPDLLDAHVDRKVSVLRVSRNMMGAASILAEEGRVFRGSRGPALLPKGKRAYGWSLNPAGMLDVEPGYGGIPTLAERVASVQATLPDLRPLTPERLCQLPTRGATCSLAVFGTWPMPDVRAAGAIWLLHSYLPDDDIAEGVLLLRPEHGVSEHGSVYGRQLLRVGGEITGAPALPLSAALELTSADYDVALAVIRPQPRAA